MKGGATQDVWEALEATASTPDSSRFMSPANASRRSIFNHRDYLMRFLTEVDGELSVAELREALEEYA